MGKDRGEFDERLAKDRRGSNGTRRTRPKEMKKRRRKERGMESHSSPWRRESKVDMFDEDGRGKELEKVGFLQELPLI